MRELSASIDFIKLSKEEMTLNIFEDFDGIRDLWENFMSRQTAS